MALLGSAAVLAIPSAVPQYLLTKWILLALEQTEFDPEKKTM
jgi:hypothetical protein